VVDAKTDSAAAFYLRLGFQLFESQPMRLFIPVAEVARRLAR